MLREKTIARYSTAELQARRERGESKSDFRRVQAKSEADLESDIAEDSDLRDLPLDWFKEAVSVRPKPKKALSLRVDNDVVEWFKAQGDGYQTQMNAALRAFMNAKTKLRA